MAGGREALLNSILLWGLFQRNALVPPIMMILTCRFKHVMHSTASHRSASHALSGHRPAAGPPRSQQ